MNEDGDVWVDSTARQLGVTEEHLEREKERQLQAIRKRRARYGSPASAARIEGRIVIVVDDDIATGSTLVAALRGVRKRRPARLVAAAGVASRGAIERLRPEVDELVILDTPDPFFSVGGFFEDFAQVTDNMVVETLRQGSTAGKSD